jgi:hypothetical protein
MVVASVMVIVPPEDLVDLVQIACGLGRYQQHFDGRFLGSEAMRKLCVEVNGRAAFEEMERPVVLESECAAEHVDPLLAGVARRYRSGTIGWDRDPQSVDSARA